MSNWKINNHSQRKFMIQENDQEISIVEPSTNETFRILAEINLKLSKDYTKIYDDKLFVSANIEDKELNIFDKS
ncbi:hypothetical protein MT340_009990 [Staphylococcus sp. NRL 16/872]|uniref:hypothetical protein n=1 Tax=Staphylococcus sp. NRL 16/872 TaxID=2930131 RepID=UPI001FB48912|nr:MULTISPECIES: hypothetical protein [unclassified Staphylococcus]MCJ1656863.1 hypothetical protein [Staphylococcus sp. NRL 21/187]MCJ1662611.1 hypothetical protein [Staphylococcus sp. NRL 18/288]MCJ1668712.1 hypothetical protein [Staphylococcus sp. NRL 19/737]WEN68929.1 hypothetical protein MT340_009990 [Staphylococcus sp. NRL 16/872]